MPGRESKRCFFAADAGKVHTPAVVAVGRKGKSKPKTKASSVLQTGGIPSKDEFRQMQREVQQLGAPPEPQTLNPGRKEP